MGDNGSGNDIAYAVKGLTLKTYDRVVEENAKLKAEKAPDKQEIKDLKEEFKFTEERNTQLEDLNRDHEAGFDEQKRVVEGLNEDIVKKNEKIVELAEIGGEWKDYAEKMESELEAKKAELSKLNWMLFSITETVASTNITKLMADEQDEMDMDTEMQDFQSAEISNEFGTYYTTADGSCGHWMDIGKCRDGGKGSTKCKYGSHPNREVAVVKEGFKKKEFAQIFKK